MTYIFDHEIHNFGLCVSSMPGVKIQNAPHEILAGVTADSGVTMSADTGAT